MLVFLTNQLGYNLSFPLSPLPTTFRLICGLEKSWHPMCVRDHIGTKPPNHSALGKGPVFPHVKDEGS